MPHRRKTKGNGNMKNPNIILIEEGKWTVAYVLYKHEDPQNLELVIEQIEDDKLKFYNSLKLHQIPKKDFEYLEKNFGVTRWRDIASAYLFMTNGNV